MESETRQECLVGVDFFPLKFPPFPSAAPHSGILSSARVLCSARPDCGRGVSWRGSAG